MKPEIYRAELRSSTLARAEYDSVRAQLLLDFHDGSRYLYSGVQRPLFIDLVRAPSQGSFFNREIRTRFVYVRIADRN